jgi:hypothetical protein
MEPVAGAAEGLTGGLSVKAVDVGQIPGVNYGLNAIQDTIARGYDLVLDVLAPYQSVSPLSVLLLLYLFKFIVTIPLGNLFRSTKDTCYNGDKFCGNTFFTFYNILNLIIGIMMFVFYVRAMAAGFEDSGFFSVRAFLPIATVLVIVFLANWAVKAVRLINPKVADVNAPLPAGRFYTLWHLIQANAKENMDLLLFPINASTRIYTVITVAAVLTLAGKL